MKYSLCLYLSFENAILSADRGIKRIINTKTKNPVQGSEVMGLQTTTAPVLLFEFKPIRSLLYESLMIPLCASTIKLLLNHEIREQRMHLELEFHNF